MAIGWFRAVIVFGSLLLAAGCAQVDLQPVPGVSVENQPPAAGNQAPTLTGQPATSVAAGNGYSFRPNASDADGDPLQFSIDNKPSWANFSVATGELAGTPGAADTGVYSGIVIRVTDGKASAATGAFSITVTPSSVPVGTGTATLTWSPPQQNTDGSPLRDLAGYWVYRGASPAGLVRSYQVSDPAATQYVVSQLPSGTHYFAVSAYNGSGVESALSNVGSKAIP